MAQGAITAFNTDTTTRGFTGHEMIDSVGLIHMNGRVYDPTLGRFLSADPNVQALDNLQNFNRYSYVLNNPLSYTDPTGFFFAKLFKAIGKAFGKLFQAIGRALKKLLRSPIIRAIIQIVACSNPVTCVAASGAMAAAAGGSIGDVFKAMAFSFIKMQVWGAVGGAIEKLSSIGQSIVHGIVNGAITAAQGGNFLVGFASGAIGKLGGIAGQRLFGPYGSPNGILGRAFVSAVAGCAGAVISGGKCINGAVSAAFASMYNGDRISKYGINSAAEYNSRVCMGMCHGYDGTLGAQPSETHEMILDGGAFLIEFVGTGGVGAVKAVVVGGAKLFVKKGSATIYKYDLPGSEHYSIMVNGMHTHQEIIDAARNTTIAIADNLPDAIMSKSFNINDVGAANRIQNYLIGKNTGVYTTMTNSCLHHCADVLKAGGSNETVRSLYKIFK